ncbi:MAG: hypothetical protein L0G23_06705 [Ruaniaceae bacterium]|nr:hypothetical protein [Ruaniaceae bacterium]
MSGETAVIPEDGESGISVAALGAEYVAGVTTVNCRADSLAVIAVGAKTDPGWRSVAPAAPATRPKALKVPAAIHNGFVVFMILLQVRAPPSGTCIHSSGAE